MSPSKLGWFQITLVSWLHTLVHCLLLFVCATPALRLDVSRAEHWMYRARSEDIVGGQDWVVSKHQPDDWWYNHPQIHQIRDSVWYFQRCLGNESTCSLKYCHAHHFDCSTGSLWLFLVQDYEKEVHHISTWVDSSHFHSCWMTVAKIWQLDTNRKQEIWRYFTFLEVLSKCLGNFQQGPLPVVVLNFSGGVSPSVRHMFLLEVLHWIVFGLEEALKKWLI